VWLACQLVSAAKNYKMGVAAMPILSKRGMVMSICSPTAASVTKPANVLERAGNTGKASIRFGDSAVSGVRTSVEVLSKARW